MWRMTPAAALERLYGSESVEAEWFAPSFLVAVPLSKVEQIRARIRARGGALREVRELGGARFEVVFEKATFDAKVHLDDAGQIMGVRVSAANEDRWPNLAIDCVRASWKHLAVSVAIVAATLAWFVWRHASEVSFGVVAGIGVLLTAYDLGRIRLA